MPRDMDDHRDHSQSRSREHVEKDGANDDELLDADDDGQDIGKFDPKIAETQQFLSGETPLPDTPWSAQREGKSTVIKESDGPQINRDQPQSNRVQSASTQPTKRTVSDNAAAQRTVSDEEPNHFAAVQQTNASPLEPTAVPPTRTPQPATPPTQPNPVAVLRPASVPLPSITLVLPNGSQGKSFSVRVQPKLPANWQAAFTLEQLGFQFLNLSEHGINAQLDGQEIVFSGTPSTSGESTIEFEYTLPNDGAQDRPAIKKTGTVNWFVNPDPRSLWKTLEPDPSLPYAKIHSDHARVSGSATAIAASVRGRSHAHEGTFRDDDFVLRCDDATGWHLMVVCDGAGSAKFSRRGSQIACETVCRYIQPHYAGELASKAFEDNAREFYQDSQCGKAHAIRTSLYQSMGTAAHKAFQAIKAEAAQKAAELGDFNTTIIFTLAKRFDWGWFVGAFCIGDGGAAIYSNDSPVKVLNQPDGGEFAGQTRFLTMKDIWGSAQNIMDRIQFGVADDLTAVIAMTDGVSDPKFETDNRFFDTQCWHDLWQDMQNEVELTKKNPIADQQLLKWLDFWSPGNHDDRTIAILLP